LDPSAPQDNFDEAAIQRSFRRRRPIGLGLLAALLLGAVITPLALASHQPAKPQVANAPVRVGISFSPRRARQLGLDGHESFRQLEQFGFGIIRLSAYWDDVDGNGYRGLDWYLDEATRSGQPIALSVGMKGVGWPEYYIPPALVPGDTGDGQDVTRDPQLRAATLEFVKQTVLRYRDSPAVVAWQVENEPFNPAGPHRWVIGRDFLREEVAAVKELDRRPVIVNVFGHFNMLMDRAAQRGGLDTHTLLGFDSDRAEKDSVGALSRGDIFGLDVYTSIGFRMMGQEYVARASSDWPDHAARWRKLARRQGQLAWVTEAQAEPWESSRTQQTLAQPRTISPDDIRKTFEDIEASGYSTVMFWGAEYWLWRAQEGDGRWLRVVRTILRSEAVRPTASTVLT
jgi:hypothetical protein